MKIYLYVSLQIVVIALLITGGTERPKFRNDYRFEKAFNAFYKVHATAETWPKARIRCEAEGTELMVPENLDEADAVPVLILDILTKFEGVFMGMHDLYAERIYVTLNGSRLLHSFLDLLWEQKEPMFNGGRCVAMRRSGRLFVHPCHAPLPFVCKISAEAIIAREECDSYNLNWIKGPNESCYWTHPEPQNWFDAYSTCLSAGGHLMVIDNHEEAEYIRRLYKEVGEQRMPNNDVAFAGFSDLFQRHHYRTVHGRRVQETGYSDWDIAKCSNDIGKGRELRCGGVRRSGLLTVSDCDIPAMFICEKPAKIPNTNSQGARIRAHDKHPEMFVKAFGY